MTHMEMLFVVFASGVVLGAALALLALRARLDKHERLAAAAWLTNVFVAEHGEPFDGFRLREALLEQREALVALGYGPGARPPRHTVPTRPHASLWAEPGKYWCKSVEGRFWERTMARLGAPAYAYVPPEDREKGLMP